MKLLKKLAAAIAHIPHKRVKHGDVPREVLIKAMSDDSLIASIVTMAGELLRRSTQKLVSGDGIETISVTTSAQFSRAEVSDYLHIVNLWNGWVAENLKSVAPRACPACTSTDGDFAFRSYDGYEYRSCKVCGAWYVPLAVNDGLIERFFTEVPEAQKTSDDMMIGRDRLTRDGDRARFGPYFDLVNALIPHDRRPIRYVDMGCGVGHSVELASQLGWRAVGVELNRAAVKTARNAGRNVIHPDEWDATDTYDVVSLFETLEHITEPDSVIAKAAARLSRGGVVFITIPNRACFEVTIMKEKCLHVFGGSENVGHINLLDPDSLGILLARHGLKLKYVDGQFSSDLLQIVSRLCGDQRSIPELMKKDLIDLTFARTLHTLINNIGPSLSILERALGRSPIIMGIACRAEDETLMGKAFDALNQRRNDQIMAQLENI